MYIFTLFSAVQAQEPAPVESSEVLFNEVHADPHPTMGDANGDGRSHPFQDEFIEIVNFGVAEADLSGAILREGPRTRHIFAEGTRLPAGLGLVVFGGGTLQQAPPGAQFVVSSTGGLGLRNAGTTLTLTDADGLVIDALSYGAEGGKNASLTPFPSGIQPTRWVLHDELEATRFSPGTYADGSLFEPRFPISLPRTPTHSPRDDRPKEDDPVAALEDPPTKNQGRFFRHTDVSLGSSFRQIAPVWSAGRGGTPRYAGHLELTHQVFDSSFIVGAHVGWQSVPEQPRGPVSRFEPRIGVRAWAGEAAVDATVGMTLDWLAKDDKPLATPSVALSMKLWPLKRHKSGWFIDLGLRSGVWTRQVRREGRLYSYTVGGMGALFGTGWSFGPRKEPDYMSN